MPLIKYVGPIDYIDVPRYGLGGIASGSVLSVSDFIADDLTRQSANWQLVEDTPEEEDS